MEGVLNQLSDLPLLRHLWRYTPKARLSLGEAVNRCSELSPLEQQLGGNFRLSPHILDGLHRFVVNFQNHSPPAHLMPPLVSNLVRTLVAEHELWGPYENNHHHHHPHHKPMHAPSLPLPNLPGLQLFKDGGATERRRRDAERQLLQERLRTVLHSLLHDLLVAQPSVERQDRRLRQRCEELRDVLGEEHLGLRVHAQGREARRMAGDMFRKMEGETTPQAKLECLVKAFAHIQAGGDSDMNADDLLPSLVLAIVHSHASSLHQQLAYIMDYGVYGHTSMVCYFITSMVMAISFIHQMNDNLLAAPCRNPSSRASVHISAMQYRATPLLSHFHPAGDKVNSQPDADDGDDDDDDDDGDGPNNGGDEASVAKQLANHKDAVHGGWWDEWMRGDDVKQGVIDDADMDKVILEHTFMKQSRWRVWVWTAWHAQLLPGRIVYFRAEDEPDADGPKMAAGRDRAQSSEGSAGGWSGAGSGGDVRTIELGHCYVEMRALDNQLYTLEIVVPERSFVFQGTRDVVWLWARHIAAFALLHVVRLDGKCVPFDHTPVNSDAGSAVHADEERRDEGDGNGVQRAGD